MELTSVAWYVVIVSFCVFSAIESVDKHSFLRKVDCEIYITPWSRSSTHLGINLMAFSVVIAFV